MPQTGRPATRLRAPSRAALLPTVLLLAAGSSLGGMAVLPPAGAAADQRAAPAARATPPPPSPALAARAQELAQELAAARREERASRDRRGTPPVAVAPPAPVATPAPPPPPAFVRPGIGRLTSGYGQRWGRLHAGIDLASGIGSPVSAVAAGTVVSAGEEGAYGLVVRVQHPDGALTLYAHLSALHVVVGQRLTAGTYVGREGSSGRSTGPHLHFEVRIAGVPVDPTPWLKARGIDPAQPVAPPPP